MKVVHNVSPAWGLVLILPLLLVAPPLASQDAPGSGDTPPMSPVDDVELESFAVAYLDVQELQSEVQEETDGRVEESALGIERFYEIHQLAQQSESSAGLSGVEDDELTEYKAVLEEVIEVQEEKQTEMVEVVEDEGLTVKRFNEIMLGIREDQQLAARAEEALEIAIDEQEGDEQ